MNEIARVSEIAIVDPVQAEIIRFALQSIPDLIETDLTRTAFSPLVYEYKDYAVGIVDAAGRAIALATIGIPGFLVNTLGEAVRDGIATYGVENIEPGDVIITNHAGTIGQHLNNVVMYTPIFGRGGKLRAFMAVTVHWVDIGGRVPGSFTASDTTELVQEGLQLRSVKLYRRGERVEEMFRVIQYNTRQPEMLMGDIGAQYAGCMRGRELFEQLMERHGENVLFAAIEDHLEKTKAAAYDAVRAIPEGTYSLDAFLDDDGIDRGTRIPVKIKVHIRDGNFIVDFSDVGDQMRGPFNSGIDTGAIGSARIAFKYLFSPREPANEGSFAPVQVIAPPGKFVSASATAAVGLYQTPLATVVDAIIGAMAKAVPDRVAAGHFGAHCVTGLSGINPRTRSSYNFFETAHGGWGASAHGDGAGPLKTIRHADNKDIPVETLEALYPVLTERYEFRQDSAGPGKYRGGLGLDKTFRLLADCKFSAAFERSACPPWGLAGGLPGESNYGEVEAADGERKRVLKVTEMPLKKGERIHIHSGGGGGYGDPRQRNRDAIRRDVVRGYVSREKAMVVYGWSDDAERATSGEDSSG
jgi:N-methylhydantoinase B